MYWYPFGTYERSVTLYQQTEGIYQFDERFRGENFFHCYFFDQEPLYDFTLDILNDDEEIMCRKFNKEQYPFRFNVLANSEKSDFVNNFVQTNNYRNWYYFFHGFAALDWYRDFQFLPANCFDRFDKVFICHNHLTTKYRSYRLHLVSNLINRNLIEHGHVSSFHCDSWLDTIKDSNNLLDNRARSTIFKTLRHVPNNLIIDTCDPVGSLSADVNADQLTSALFHIVTETVYFLPKLHLTEKVFKPIVAKRPFILVAAPGNLAYLKSYGFKTFDRWVDESYDLEQDNYLRIEKITAEIEKLCALSPAELEQMHQEMQKVLEYNFRHFYSDFRKMITNELVDNFADILNEINFPVYQHSPEYLQQVKQRLLG